MKTTALIRITPAMLLVLTFATCNSGHLSRANAKAQLEKAAKQQVQQAPDGPHSLTTQIGIVSGNCYDQEAMHGYDPVRSSEEDAVLVATRCITTRPIKKNVWNVELTQHGQQLETLNKGEVAQCDDFRS